MTNPARPLFCLIPLIALCVAALSLMAQAPADSGVTAIRAGKLFDAKSGKMVENQVILVHGDQIQQVGSGLPIPPGAKVIDLSKATVMPGFIDVHTHLTMNAGQGGPQGLYRFRAPDGAHRGEKRPHYFAGRLYHRAQPWGQRLL